MFNLYFCKKTVVVLNTIEVIKEHNVRLIQKIVLLFFAIKNVIGFMNQLNNVGDIAAQYY